MCRWIEETDAKGNPEKRVCGVLTDYDLSSWTEHLRKDNTRTSQHRTGTPPYMAFELLDGTNPTHLYRHDIESLFYVMLVMCCRNAFGCAKDDAAVFLHRPFEEWFDEKNYRTLANSKARFFLGTEAFRLPSTFRDFYPWLDDLQFQFSDGFEAKDVYVKEQRRRKRLGISTGRVSQFDEETLGGHICYSSFIEPVRKLKGQLKSLAIRYDPPQSLHPAPPDAMDSNL